MKEDEITMKGWDAIAKAFQDRYQIEISPIVYSPFGPTEDELNLLGDKKGRRIIDIGAGGCQKAIYLARQGAKVTAYDISQKQLDIGRALAKEQGVTLDFVRGDFQSLSSHFPEKFFDKAYSIFALQYSRNRERLQKTFAEINKILGSGGTFVFSLDHPFRSLGFWDLEKDRYVIDNYFDRTENEWDYAFPEAEASGRFRGACWTLGDMVNGLVNSGFKLEQLLEPEPIAREEYFDKFGVDSRHGRNNRKDPFNYENLKRIPGTIIIKGVKE